MSSHPSVDVHSGEGVGIHAIVDGCGQRGKGLKMSKILRTSLMADPHPEMLGSNV
jgi:hypothetical protein